MKFIRFSLFGISFWLGQFGWVFGETDLSTLVETTQVIQAGELFAAAEENYHATLFIKAIEKYRQLLEEIEAKGGPLELLGPLCCRLGQSYIFLEDFESAYTYLERANSYFMDEIQRFQELKEQGSYHYALTCRHLKKHSLAIQILRKHLQSSCPLTSEHAKFELALNTFLINDLNSAKEQFSVLVNESTDAQLSLLAALYLSRISLAEGNYQSAVLRLESLQKIISSDNQLHPELTYLQGEAAFLMHAYSKAIDYFEIILPRRNIERAPWLYETLYYLGWCHLKIGEERDIKLEEQKHHLDKAESYFRQLLEKNPDERSFLALAHCHLVKGARLKDAESYVQAGEILSRTDSFKTLEAKTHALLLRASIATSFDDSEKALFTVKGVVPSEQDLSDGSSTVDRKLAEKVNTAPENTSLLYLCAAEAFGEAFELLKDEDKAKAALALKSQIQSYQRCNTTESLQKASETLKRYIDLHFQDLAALEDPQEFYYLYAMVACRLAEEQTDNPEQASIAEQILLKALKDYPKGHFSDACLKLLAAFYLQSRQLVSAEKVFFELVEFYPNSTLASDALYWGIYCSEKLNREESQIQEYRKRLFENYPDSPFAAKAYFDYYSYRQYLQGDRAAIKHLQTFKDKFPNTPLQITAYYLTGLDYKRERRSAEGRSIRKKNLIKAINNFFKAETQFEELNKQRLIDEDQMPYFAMIRYCSLLERALANQAVADDSSAAKRAIYLQYAQELFMQINREMVDLNHPIASYLTKTQPFPKIQQESLYYLMQSYINGGNIKAADRAIEQILAKYTSLGITKNYYLSCIYYEQGMVCMRKGEYEAALKAFELAEQSNEGGFLSINQKLDLWIQQSMCYKALYQTDHAMLILSKVINDNTVSSLRVKAMYLRAEVYTLQGRHELARKQLEATAKKGGEWAIKAKVKLDEEYGTR